MRYEIAGYAATGIGSMPGTDPAWAARAIAGELSADEMSGLPFLAELPDRGPGADMIGRTTALLVDMPAEVTPRGWKLSSRPGRDQQRARSMLSADLDEMEGTLDGYQGPLKVQLAGPWTLAATLEQPRSFNRALSDPGAVRDIADSLAEAAQAHLKDVVKRVPGAIAILQLDEPALPAVRQGRVPTASGYSRIPPVEDHVLAERLAAVIGEIPEYTVVHCCAPDASFGIMSSAGADAVATDLSQLRSRDIDELAEAIDGGLGLLAGVPAAKPEEMARVVADLWGRTGLDPRPVVMTPPCGLVGVSPDEAVAALRGCREAARILGDMMEDLR
jgi:methionine synthase II (cobalamin-independent)